MTTTDEAARRLARPRLIASVAVISCLGLTAAPVANADGPVENVRNAVIGARNNSLCNPLQPSGELEGYAQKWVSTARALGTLNTPTFPADAYPGDPLGNIASADPTSTAINELMSIANEDIQKCSYYQYGVGMSRDDVIGVSYVAVIVGKPDAPKPEPKPPVNGLPPEPAQQQPQPEPQPPAKPTVVVNGDVDVYDVPGGVGTIIGALQGGEGQTVQLLTCQDDNWCQIFFAAGRNGQAWVWGDFLDK